MKSENKILQLKYASKRFGVMSGEERDLHANRILMKISVITGWVWPTKPEMIDMLIEELAKKMEPGECYEALNEEEVSYAFRNRGIDVKDWGKVLNLSLIDEILLPYLDNRVDLSMQEEKISNQIKLPKDVCKIDGVLHEKVAEPMSDEEWEDWLLDIANYSVNKIPCDSYEYLVRTGKIVLTGKQKHEYMERSIAHLVGITDPDSLDGIELAKMKAKGEYSPVVTASLITISKRLAVFDFFNKKEDAK